MSEPSETICPNCGALRPGPFCGQCGQNSRDYNASLWTVLKAASTEMFEFDGRVVRSLSSMFRSPGKLSLAFVNNQRASFVNPFRLLMFTTILWFFLFGLSLDPPDDRPRPRPSEPQLEVTVEGQENETQPDRDPRFRPPNLDDEDVSKGLEILRSHLEGDRAWKLDEVISTRESSRRIAPLRTVAQILGVAPDTPKWLQRLMSNVVVDFVHSPQVLLNELFDNLALMMVVLLPWYAILLTIFFGRRGRRFIHHLVFAIHVHSFTFIVLVLLVLTPSSQNLGEESIWGKIFDWIDQLIFLALMVHTYFAFKNFYGQGHVRTILKYFSLGFFYLWGLLPAFSFVVLLLLAEYF